MKSNFQYSFSIINAKWVLTDQIIFWKRENKYVQPPCYICSNCNNFAFKNPKSLEFYNYCPFCGASMSYDIDDPDIEV